MYLILTIVKNVQLLKTIQEEYQLKIENLSQGMIIPNYKEMCNLLNEKITDGNSKKSQLEEWNRYFSYEKIGNKFKITEIYSSPKPKMSNALYIKFIELLLMYELSTKNGYTCNYTKTNLFYLLGMANYNYFKNNRYLVSNQISHIPNWQVNHFYMRSNQKLTDILFSALNSMKKRCLLDYDEQRVIVKGNNSWIANDAERKQILKAEKDVLNDMGYKTIPFIRIEEFYSRVNEKLHEKFGWDFVYKEYKLIYTKEYMSGDIPVVKNEIAELVRKNKLDLNDKILEAINKQAEYYYKENCKKYSRKFQSIIDEGWGYEKVIDFENRTKIDGVFNYPVDYIENQKYLADVFLNIQ